MQHALLSHRTLKRKLLKAPAASSLCLGPWPRICAIPQEQHRLQRVLLHNSEHLQPVTQILSTGRMQNKKHTFQRVDLMHYQHLQPAKAGIVSAGQCFNLPVDLLGNSQHLQPAPTASKASTAHCAQEVGKSIWSENPWHVEFNHVFSCRKQCLHASIAEAAPQEQI